MSTYTPVSTAISDLFFNHEKQHYIMGTTESDIEALIKDAKEFCELCSTAFGVDIIPEELAKDFINRL